MKRHQFGQMLLGAGLTTVLAQGCQPTSQSQASDFDQTWDVIVIGAGIAGLSAARELQDQDVNVLVLEAQERIGGRIWTTHSLNNIPLDLGASWIHGTEDNPLTEITQSHGIKTYPTDYENILVFDVDGHPLTDPVIEEIDQQFYRLLTQVENSTTSAQGSLQQGFNRVTAHIPYTPAQRRYFNYAINTTVEHEAASDIAHLSLRYWDTGEGFGGDDVLFPGGYGQIIEVIAQQPTPLKIRTQHIVQTINYQQPQQIEVTTDQGVFTAAQVLVTVPLGVLKKGKIVFIPALPQAKQTAIQRLGMGVLNKVYFQFPQAFWHEDEPDLLGYVSAEKGQWCEWYNLYPATGQPILLGFNAGAYGQVLESLSDRDTVKAGLDTLKTMFGADIPAPLGTLITRWGAHPFSYGSYSHIPPGASPADYAALATPVAQQLFFAGEATSADYFATVHGAFLSGQREAERILQS